MNEIVERVAKAISAKQLANCKTTWEECHPDFHAERYEWARSAIEAMREPTDAMLNGAEGATNYEDELDERKQANTYWRAMIDEALK